jgi:hypothetical protein
MNVRSAARATCFLATVLLASLSVHAQLFRAYVSVSGSDSNGCTLQQPCRLLPAALNAVRDGGEIWMLNSANYNTGTVNIAKSVSILAVPGVVGSVVSTGGGDAIVVNGTSIAVSLRNLKIVALGTGKNGITFINGSSLVVAACEIANMPQFGIEAYAPGGNLSVVDSATRDSLAGIVVESGVTAVVDRTRITGNQFGVSTDAGGRTTVTDSMIVGGTIGVNASVSSPTTPGQVMVTVERTHIAGAGYAVQSRADLAGDVIQVTVSRSSLVENQGAIAVQQADSSSASVVADDNVISGNGIGFVFVHGGAIATRGNNTLHDNGVDRTLGIVGSLAGF